MVFFYPPEGPLQGVMTVSLAGYRTVEHTPPEEVAGNSTGLYRLDLGLMTLGERILAAASREPARPVRPRS